MAIDADVGMCLEDGVHRIGPLRGGYTKGGFSQAYLFEDVDGLTLVDTLWDADAHVILKYLWEIGRTPDELTNIALTHSHRSHLGGLAMLKRLAPKATVHAHAWESGIIRGTRRGQPVPLWPPAPVELIPFRILSQLGLPKHEPCEVDVDLQGAPGERVGPLTVVPTPGHTPGHLAFHWAERDILVAGDAVATWPRFDAGWPDFNLDEAEYQRSLQKLVAMAPRIVCPGHGDAIVEDAAFRIEALLKGPHWPAATA